MEFIVALWVWSKSMPGRWAHPTTTRRAFLVPSLFDLYIHCSGMSLVRARVPFSMEGRSTSSKVLWTS